MGTSTFVEEGLKAVHHSFICINQCLSCSRFLLNHFKSMKFHIHLFTSTIDSFFLYSTMYWDPYNPNKKRQQLLSVYVALCCYYVVLWSLEDIQGCPPCTQPNSHGPLVTLLMELYCKINLKNLMYCLLLKQVQVLWSIFACHSLM